MDDREFASLCARLNAAVEMESFIRLLDYHPDRAVKVGKLWRLLCPIHGESIFRSLVLNPRRNTYHCEHVACPGHQPSDLIDLLSRARGLSRTGAVALLVEQLGPDELQLKEDEIARLGEYIASSRQTPGS